MQAEAWEVPSGCLPRKEGKPKGLGPVAIVIVTLTVTGEEQSRASPPPIGYPAGLSSYKASLLQGWQSRPESR